MNPKSLFAVSLFVSLPALGVDPSSVYPLATGTKLTYVTQAGETKTTEVTGVTKVRFAGETVEAAVVRRTNGSTRAVLQNGRDWIECGPVEAGTSEIDCARPLVFFRWPLAEGTRWGGGTLDFVVEGSERIEVPAGPFPSWRIRYAPPGETELFGLVWMAEGTGPVRILEKETEYRLVRFERGNGPLSAPIPEAVASRILEPAGGERHTGVLTFLKGVSSIWIVTILFLTAFLSITFALFLALRGKGEEEPALDERIRKNPGYPDLHYQLSQVYQARNDWAAARASLETALSINPRYLKARIDLASVLRASGETAKAIEALEEALRIDPESEEARRLLDECRDSAQRRPE